MGICGFLLKWIKIIVLAHMGRLPPPIHPNFYRVNVLLWVQFSIPFLSVACIFRILYYSYTVGKKVLFGQWTRFEMDTSDFANKQIEKGWNRSRKWKEKRDRYF